MAEKLYVISNSHLDPVWLWNRSSGRSAWLNTMHSVVRIMDEEPDLKFTCSASSLYRYMEECDISLFRRVSELVQAGRWEIVGGWEVQSDVIISRPETLIHQALSGKEYFYDRFGVDVKTAYNVDSFGHSAGLPKILKSTGFTHYVFMRSQDTPQLFRWEADDGSAVTALHIYKEYSTKGDEDDFHRTVRAHLASPLKYQTMFFGVGDHGGGISRRELAILREYQKDHDIVFSTLEEYFDEVKDLPLETVRGELGPVFRGCYANCHEVKRKISRAVRRVQTAQKLCVPAAELAESWRELLFNHFHDILPGTSIREAYERDIFPGIGSVEHQADKLIDRQLFRRCSGLDTEFMSEGGVYCWNPHPFEYTSIMSFDGFADPNRNAVEFNVLRDREGNEFPLQLLPPAPAFGPCGAAWGKLTAVIPLPPMGEGVFAYGVSDRNFPFVGFERQKELVKKLSFEVYFDNSRTWGFGLVRYDAKLGSPELVKVEELLDGPVCSILRAVYKYKSSEIRLDLCQYTGISETGVRIRLDWHEEKCCLKFVFAHGLKRPEFFCGSSAASVKRLAIENYDWPAKEWIDGKMGDMHPSTDEYSMIDWCGAADNSRMAAFFTPDLHSCDHENNCIRLTINRPVLYSDHLPFAQKTDDGWMDMGVSYRNLWIAEYDENDIAVLPRRAHARLNNGEIREVTAHPAGDSLVPGFFRFSLPYEQVVMQELRFNEADNVEITLLNNGEDVVVVLPEIGKVKLPAHALRRFTF